MNKKGSKTGTWFSIITVLLVVVVLGVIMVSVVNERFADEIGGLPTFVSTVYDIIIAVFEPVVRGLYLLVTPEGQNQNIKMIAFSIFLLMTLVGSYALIPLFKEPFIPFFIAVIVGIIAARSITTQILRDSGIAAAPWIALSLFLSFGIVFTVSKNVKKFSDNPLMHFIILSIVGLVMFFGYWFIAESVALGLVYGLGTISIGAVDFFYPMIKEKMEEHESYEAGKFLGKAEKIEESAEEMTEAYQDWSEDQRP